MQSVQTDHFLHCLISSSWFNLSILYFRSYIGRSKRRKLPGFDANMDLCRLLDELLMNWPLVVGAFPVPCGNEKMVLDVLSWLLDEVKLKPSISLQVCFTIRIQGRNGT